MAQPTLFDAPASRAEGEPLSRPPGALVPVDALAPEGLRGIARLAARAPELDYRNEVEYRDLPCRSVISRVDSGRVPFEFGINPYRGCEFGCAYCYARYTHEFMELEEWLDFERKVFVKRGAREALVEDLRRLELRGRSIAIGTATDPYQPAERRCGVTRSLLEVFAGRRGLRLSVTTKSDLVLRDLELLARIREHNSIAVNVTITTPCYRLGRKLEPRAPRPDRRLEAVRKLAEAGISTGVFLMPLMPRINDRLADLDLLVGLAREAGAEYLAMQVLYLRRCSRKRFFPFIEEQFPGLLSYYRRLYGSRSSEALAAYTRSMTEEVRRLKEKHGLLARRGSGPERAGDQPVLALE